MYLRESKQKRADGSLVTYLQLAENTWNPEKRRAETRILCNCGRADDEAVIERLRRKSILRRRSPEQIVAEGPEWRLVCAWPYGDVYALQALWERLGIGQILTLRPAPGGWASTSSGHSLRWWPTAPARRAPSSTATSNG